MKITKLINVETEVDVSITTEDINAALMEDTDRLHAVMCGINNIGAYLKAIPDTVLAEMNDAQKQTVAKFLNDQARRFMPNASNSATGDRGASPANADGKA